MTDRYENIRKALVNGLTPGPWGEKAIAAALRAAHKHDGSWIDELGDGENMPDEDDASLIAACDPDTIRELMAERDALLDALRQIAEWPDGGNRYGQANIKRFAQATIATAEQQPTEGEEIMVNTPQGVFTLPLHPSGLSSGPRFVVHVPELQRESVTVRYDLSPAQTESAIRDALIRMGWTPPTASKEASND